MISEIFCLLNAFLLYIRSLSLSKLADTQGRFDRFSDRKRPKGQVQRPDYKVFLVLLQNKRWDDLPRCGISVPGEESPDRTGHPAGESPDGSNLMAS